MPVTREKADYHEKTSIAEFIGNPLIAALPGSVPQSEMLKKLIKLPPHDKEDCFKDAYDRLQLLSRICTVHIPFSQDLFIARSLSRCINWGYVSRNPIPFSVTANVLSAHQIDVTQDLENYLTHTVFPIYGFSVLGISGVGKSSSVLNALRQYTQVIEHETYADQPFKCSQLVWLKVDCPGDGTPKGLCTTILREVDAVLGTQYTSEIYSRISKDTLISKVAMCLSSHHLGVLVIDDIQNLCGAKKDTSLDMLSFLIYLMESFAIPVVMVGTPKVLTLFQQEFQMAKRATGDGTVRMELLKKDSSDWNRFINTIWYYQFIRNPVALTPEMNDVFYEESVGNPFLCSLLYKLVQDDAITSNAESFTLTDVKKVAEEKLCITATMRKNMLSGNDEELKRYEYLWRSAELPVPELSNPISKPAVSDEKSETLSYLVKKLTENKSINIAEAAKLAQIAMEAKPGCSGDELLGFARKYYDSTKPSAENQQLPSGSEHPLTER
jgi:hypothetical protein